MADVVLGGIAAGLALCGASFYALCLWSARKFLREAGSDSSRFAPPVSILKPLRGADPHMYESFRSHCVQDYPEFEMIFGVSSLDDPAVEAVHRLMREFPNRSIRLALSPEALGTNGKVSTLIQMLPLARYEHVIVNDSDIYVPPGYLRQVMTPFERPDVGMVTCPYRGIAAGTLGSRLEALGISTDFLAGVLAARQLEKGIHFGLGSTLAMSRRALEAIGGLRPLVDFLADDYEMGSRISKAGFQVVLSQVVVETYLPAYDFQGFLNHQLRWARSTRDSRRGGYLGLAFTFGLPWAIIATAFSPASWWSWTMLALCACLRAAVAWRVGWGVARDPDVLRRLWLLPLRDLAALGIWAASFAGRSVHWRGEMFVLERGKLYKSKGKDRPEDISAGSQADAQQISAPPPKDKASVHS